MTPHLLRALACMVTLSATAALAQQPPEPALRFSRPVMAPQRSQEELLAVPLDAHVFAHTRDGFPDVRLLGRRGEAIPFLLRHGRSHEVQLVRKSWTASNPSLRPLDNGGLEITLRLEDRDPPVSGLRLLSPLKNFVRRVRVESSADGANWDPLADETVVFDYAEFMDVRQDSIPFPATTRRHIRLIIDDATAEQESQLLELTRRLRGNSETERVERVAVERRPFRIDRIEFWNESRQERTAGQRKQFYSIAGFRVEHDAKSQQTTVDIDAQCEPLTSFAVVTPTRNFSRRAVVEAAEPGDQTSAWRKIGEATISRIDYRTFAREQLGITFSETRRTRYRIVVDNRDSPPLEITGVAAEGIAYELIFLAAPDGEYRVNYDSESATAPRYDTAAIEALLREGYEPNAVTLGEPVEGTAAGQPRAFAWSRLLSDTRLLAGIVVLLVIALGWGLYSAGRRLEKLPQEEHDSASE